MTVTTCSSMALLQIGILDANVQGWPELLQAATLFTVVFNPLDQLIPELFVEAVVADILAPSSLSDSSDELLKGQDGLRLEKRTNNQFALDFDLTSITKLYS